MPTMSSGEFSIGVPVRAQRAAAANRTADLAGAAAGVFDSLGFVENRPGRNRGLRRAGRDRAGAARNWRFAPAHSSRATAIAAWSDRLRRSRSGISGAHMPNSRRQLVTSGLGQMSRTFLISPARSSIRTAVMACIVLPRPISSARTPSSRIQAIVVLVAGLEPTWIQSSDAVDREAAAFEQVPQDQRLFRLIAVARANPDAQPLQFPPSGVGGTAEHVESHVLWRWIGTQQHPTWSSSSGLTRVSWPRSRRTSSSTSVKSGAEGGLALPLLQSLTQPITPSSVHEEIDRRLTRLPRALAEELARVYGSSSRSRTTSRRWRSSAASDSAHGTMSSACSRPTSMARRTASRGRRSPRSRTSVVLRVRAPNRRRSRESAGAARGCERLYRERRTARVHAAARRVERSAVHGRADPGHGRRAHWAQRRYFDMAARHVAFMQQIVLRPDGSDRHQASTDAAWGGAMRFRRRPGADPVGVSHKRMRTIRACWRCTGDIWQRCALSG